MTKLSPLVGLCLLAMIPMADAGIRLQHYVPELKGMAKPVEDPDEQLEAFIFTPNGVTCNLPSANGYCRIPMTWMTTKGQQVSLWRQDGDQELRVAYAYDGQNDAYLTLGQKLTYRLHDGPMATQRQLDSVELKAIWDDSWATHPPAIGEISAENDGLCSLYSGETSCEVILNWSSDNVTSASVWQRTQSGLTPLIQNVKTGSVAGFGYEYPAIYELREGGDPSGALLSSVMTKGVQPETKGTLTFPDGETCLALSNKSTCELRAAWEGNDIGRLWIRDKSQSNARLSGQALISIPLGQSIVDLRASSKANGTIIDRKTIKAEQSLYSARFRLVEPTACTILYAADSCEQTIHFKTDAPTSTVWDENGGVISNASEGTFRSLATERGISYTLREGSDPKSPPLASFISEGIKQTYTGSLATKESTQCVFNYQRGTCNLKLDYTSTDNTSIWNAQTARLQGGGSTGGTVSVQVNNYDGAQETQNTFDLRFHGAQSPKLSNPWLDSAVLSGVRPAHTGTLTPSSTSCNMIYSRNDCGLVLTTKSSSPVVTLWKDDSGEMIWSGAPGATIPVTVPSGESSYSLREGVDVRNDALSTVSLKANRPTYFQQLKATVSECTASIYGGACNVNLTSSGNTSARIWYRPITSTGLSASYSGNSSFGGNISITPKGREDQVWVVQVRLGTGSSGELLDEMEVIAHANAPHSFKLLQSISGKPENGFCTAYESSASCVGTWDPSWETSASMVTACLFNKDAGVAATGGITGGAGSISYNHTSQRSINYEQRFFEGSVSCTTADALLATADLPGVKVIPAEEYPFALDNDSYSCEMPYVGVGACSVTAKVVSDSHYTGQSSYPAAYLKVVGRNESPSFFSLSGASASRTVSIAETEQGSQIELRIRKGSQMAESDPVLDTATLNYTRTDVIGGAYPSYSQITNGAWYNTDYVEGIKTGAPYLKRTKVEDGFADPEPCLVNANSATCTAYFWLNSGPTSASRASLFINGQYKAVVGGNSSTPGYVLDIGDHRIELREGQGSAASDNKVLDAFTVRVKRPDANYFGNINLPEPLPTPTYFLNNTTLSYSFETNTSGYVFDRDANKLVCKYDGPVVPSETNKNRMNCSVALQEGTYTYDLYSKNSNTGEDSKLLDSKTFTIMRRENTARIQPAPSYEATFETCQLSYSQNLTSCRMYYNYLLSSGDTNKTSAMACAYNDSGALTGTDALLYKAAWTMGNIMAQRGTTSIRIYDGLQCPATIAQAQAPMLFEWPVSLKETTPYGTAVISGAAISSVGDGQYTCTRRYHDETCSYSVAYSTYPKGDPGAAYMPTYSVLYRNDSLFRTDSRTDENYTVSDSLGQGVTTYNYKNVACKLSSSKSASNCPIENDTVMAEVVVNEVVPEYTGKIELPEGSFCEAQYGVTTCPLQVKVESDSSYISLYRDGVLLTRGSSIALQSYALPVKENGAKTKLSLYDGTTDAKGRLIDEVEVWAKKQDPNEFRFNDVVANGKAGVSSVCYISSLIAAEGTQSCPFSLSYTGDSSRKTLTPVSPGVDALSANKVSASGSVSASHLATRIYTTDYTFVHQDGLTPSRIKAYRDDGAFYLHQSDPIAHGQTAFGATYAGTPFGEGFTPGITRGSYQRQRYCWGQAGYGGGCAYREAGSNYLNAYSTDIVADDITLRAVSTCNAASNSNIGCGRIPFNVLTASLVQNQQRVFGFKTDASALTRKIFYRVRSVSEDRKAQMIDPSINAKGISRTLNMDGQWHVIDLTNNKMAGGSDTTFTFYNLGTAFTVSVDYFLETEPTP